MRQLVALLIVTGVAAATAAPAALPSTMRGLGTSIDLYTPFNGYGVAAGIRVLRSVSGYCWTTSSSDARGDAYRCFVGNFIHDPCFASGNGGASTFVLCPLYYPTSKVLRINLTKALPANPTGGDPTRYAPWAIQLGNGKWCEIIDGATGLVAGMRINYGCTGGTVLIGNPRRATATWTIFYASSLKVRQYQPVPIKAAWW